MRLVQLPFDTPRDTPCSPLQLWTRKVFLSRRNDSPFKTARRNKTANVNLPSSLEGCKPPRGAGAQVSPGARGCLRPCRQGGYLGSGGARVPPFPQCLLLLLIHTIEEPLQPAGCVLGGRGGVRVGLPACPTPLQCRQGGAVSPIPVPPSPSRGLPGASWGRGWLQSSHLTKRKVFAALELGVGGGRREGGPGWGAGIPPGTPPTLGEPLLPPSPARSGLSVAWLGAPCVSWGLLPGPLRGSRGAQRAGRRVPGRPRGAPCSSPGPRPRRPPAAGLWGRKGEMSPRPTRTQRRLGRPEAAGDGGRGSRPRGPRAQGPEQPAAAVRSPGAAGRRRKKPL